MSERALQRAVARAVEPIVRDFVHPSRPVSREIARAAIARCFKWRSFAQAPQDGRPILARHWFQAGREWVYDVVTWKVGGPPDYGCWYVMGGRALSHSGMLNPTVRAGWMPIHGHGVPSIEGIEE